MADTPKDDAERFALDLPFYVNGTVEDAIKQWMDDYIAAHPEAREELEWLRRVREERLIEYAEAEPDRIQRLLKAWRAERRQASPWGRLRDWLTRPHGIPGAWVAAGVLLVLAQSVMHVHLAMDDDTAPRYRDERAAPGLACARLRVAFSPTAPQAEVVLLLRKAEATVVGGPSETGDWWLAIPRGRSVEEAATLLRSSPLVDDVALLDLAPQAPCAR